MMFLGAGVLGWFGIDTALLAVIIFQGAMPLEDGQARSVNYEAPVVPNSMLPALWGHRAFANTEQYWI